MYIQSNAKVCTQYFTLPALSMTADKACLPASMNHCRVSEDKNTILKKKETREKRGSEKNNLKIDERTFQKTHNGHVIKLIKFTITEKDENKSNLRSLSHTVNFGKKFHVTFTSHLICSKINKNKQTML